LEIKTSRQQVWELLLLSVIGIITTSLIVVLIQKKNQMRSNNMLVIKNREIVKSERLLYEKKKELENIIDSYREQNINDNHIHAEKYSQSKLDKTDEKLLLESIEKLMTDDKLFLQSDLSLDKLAKQLGTNRSYISQVINDNYKQNFNNFLNQYRIKEVCYLLSDPVNQNKTIEGIAQEVGFNSITTFNRCFKKHTGVNPSFYMKVSRTE
ncbi:MAG TPA: helix-turn-helix transcriptional regulator, partial [Bacteroidales bacterium]